MMEITVNGEAQTTAQGQTILGLIQQLELDPARVAVELDRRIVKRPCWPETVLCTGAQLEIVQFVGGG
jgi:thiamine biosynthesis protein ThiS